MFQKIKRKIDLKLLKSYKLKPCVICDSTPSDPCHIKSVGSGGNDLTNNLLPMCRSHHIEQHKVGMIKMMDKYDRLYEHMLALGWLLERINGKEYLTNTAPPLQ